MLSCVLVLFSVQQNRPLNAQNVADALQKYNLKKTAVQKALDSLADSRRIAFKEYGKQKIYIARQDQFEIPNSEELNHMKEENAKLQEQINQQKRAIGELEGGMLILVQYIHVFCFIFQPSHWEIMKRYSIINALLLCLFILTPSSYSRNQNVAIEFDIRRHPSETGKTKDRGMSDEDNQLYF